MGKNSEFSDGVWKIIMLADAASLSISSHKLPVLHHNLKYILHKCLDAENSVYALSLHVYFCKAGLETHRLLGNFLMQLLVKAGSIPDAQRVFNKLSYQSSCSWNSLVTGYVKHNKFHDALTVFQKMEKFSIDLNRHTLIAILKACVKLKDIEKSLKIHTELKRKRQDIGIFLSSMLIDMYVKCGFFQLALEEFENLPVRDTVLWTALIVGFTDQGFHEKAMCLVEQMQLEGLYPDAITLLCSLNVCSAVGAIDKGQEMHTDIIRRGMLEDNNLNISNALIDMYAKYGLLEDAKDVFLKLLVKDVVTWNALIVGFMKHGYAFEALACYDEMKLQGVSPDIVTFICSLKNSGSIGDIDKGFYLHDELNKRGLLKEHVSIGNALVDMYLNWGMLTRAEEVFEQLPVKDIITWTTLISGYANHGCSEKALDHFELLLLETICPNNVTYVSILKACANSCVIENGQRIHDVITKIGILEDDANINEALINMYASCGLFAEAHAVLHKSTMQDLASWAVLISGYVKYHHATEAVNCFELMQFHGAAPDISTFVCGVKACGIGKFVDKGQHLHSEIVRRGYLEKDVVIGNALTDMYARFDMLSTAQELFDKLLGRNVISWTTIIEAYCNNEQSEVAWNCFLQMQQEGILPDNVTFICILKACCANGVIYNNHMFHAQLRGLGKHNAIRNALIDFYASSGFLLEAQEMFNELSIQDVFNWTSMISGFVRHGYHEDALAYFAKMRKHAIAPNGATFVCILKAYKSIRVVEKCLELHTEICTKGLFETDSNIGNAVIGMYLSLGLMAEAHRLFERLPEKDICSWAMLIAAYTIQNHNEEACQCFETIQTEGFVPDSILFSCILRACSCMGIADKGLAIHTEIIQKGMLEGNVLVRNALIDVYVNLGLVAEAHHILKGLPVQDIVSWTIVVSGYAKYGQIDRALECLARLEHGDTSCNTAFQRRNEFNKEQAIIFVSILNACSHAGSVGLGCTYFGAINGEYGIMPNMGHHMCIIDLLSRAGQLDAATLVVNMMPFHPNILIWHSILSAAKKWGFLELGEYAFAHAIQLDVEDTAAYVCLSNIYVDSLYTDTLMQNCISLNNSII